MKRFEERSDPKTGERYLAVAARGARLKDDPRLNKGTCFTRAEREALGLVGLLPPSIQTPEEQLERAYENYLRADGDVRGSRRGRGAGRGGAGRGRAAERNPGLTGGSGTWVRGKGRALGIARTRPRTRARPGQAPRPYGGPRAGERRAARS